jgi:nicotinamidase-related amidase
MNMALLIIDMQKVYYKSNAKASMDQAAEYINWAINRFRRNNKKIIWTQHENKKDGIIKGTEDFEIIDPLKPSNNEKIIIKEYDNAFNKTDLYDYCIEENIDTLIMTGCFAEYCVLSTYQGAKDKDLTPIILKKAIASGNKDNIKFVEDIEDIITIQILTKIINEE